MGGIVLITCYLCGKTLEENKDVYHEAVTEDGETVIVCNECAIENQLDFEPDTGS